MKFSSAKGKTVYLETVKPRGIPVQEREGCGREGHECAQVGVFRAQEGNLPYQKSLQTPGGIVLGPLLDGGCSSSCSFSKEEPNPSRNS